MNLKSAAMATGLVLTFAAGAWLSTIMLAPPQRPNRVAVQEQAPSPAGRSFCRANLHETLPDMPASNSILPPLPPLPPAPAATRPRRASHPSPKYLRRTARNRRSTAAPPADRNAQPPEPPPPAIAEASCRPNRTRPRHRRRCGGGTGTAGTGGISPADAAVETTPEADIDPGIAALSDLVARPPSAPTSTAITTAPDSPQPAISRHHRLRHPAPSPAPAAAPAARAGPYFTIQVGSFQDPANAASLDTEFLGSRGGKPSSWTGPTAPVRSGRLSGWAVTRLKLRR